MRQSSPTQRRCKMSEKDRKVLRVHCNEETCQNPNVRPYLGVESRPEEAVVASRYNFNDWTGIRLSIRTSYVHGAGARATTSKDLRCRKRRASELKRWRQASRLDMLKSVTPSIHFSVNAQIKACPRRQSYIHSASSSSSSPSSSPSSSLELQPFTPSASASSSSMSISSARSSTAAKLRGRNATLAHTTLPLPRQGSSIDILPVRDTDNRDAAQPSRRHRAVDGLLQHLCGIFITF